MGLGSYFRNQFYSTDLISATPAAAAADAPPSSREVYVNRLNKGCNLGGMFVLEKWIAPHMFPEGDDNGKTAEFDAVQAALKKFGDAGKVRDMWEEHWRTWIQDDDWAWMASVGVTAVRLPIGYWNVSACEFVDATDFADLHDVYCNSWDFVVKYVLEPARAHSIGVLIDVHAVPGGANSADHSGISTAKGALWDSNKCQVKTLRVLEHLAERVKEYENVVGLQVLNEAPFQDDWDTQRTFYLKALNQIRQINGDVPVIISDGWALQPWVDWTKSCDDQVSQEGKAVTGLILDEHVYRTFSDKDRNTRPRQIIDEIEQALPPACGQDVDVQVGEFSCVMDSHSWQLNDESDRANREDLVREFGNRQCAHFNERACAYYFWTYKFRWGGGGEWGFREMQEKGCLDTGFTPVDRLFPKDKAPGDEYYNEQYHGAVRAAVDAHAGYWNSQDPNRDWQHWRFEDGFRVGWLDAQAFDKVGHSVLGRRAAWKAARERQHVDARGASDMVWVFRQAFDQGAAAFLSARHHAFNS